MQGNKLTVLARGTFIQGNLFSEDLLIVEGGVEGDITGNRVIIKQGGWVRGELSCRSLSIEPGGVVDGPVKVVVQEGLPPGQVELGALPEGHTLTLPGGEDEPEGPAVSNDTPSKDAP